MSTRKRTKKTETKSPATESTETVEAPEEAATEAKLPSQNGITRPRPGSKTVRVWEIADEISAELKAPAPRAKVLETYDAEGGNPSTGATQYARWRKFHGLSREDMKPAASAAE
jgi:adenine-specific DNA methylase